MCSTMIEDFDLTSVFGFLVAATLCFRLVPRLGACWFAPVCSTFVWLGRVKFKRSKAFPLGDCRRRDVVSGNILCNRCMLLAWLCALRLIQWALEQPLSSVMEHMCRFQSRLRRKPAVRARAYFLCDFGADAAKPVRILSPHA